MSGSRLLEPSLLSFGFTLAESYSQEPELGIEPRHDDNGVRASLQTEPKHDDNGIRASLQTEPRHDDNGIWAS